MRPSYILTQFEVYMLTPEIVRFVRSCCLHFEENDYCVVRPAARCVRQSTEAVAENPPSIRHQNLAIFELFSRHSGAEKPDEKRVLLIALALFISAGFAQENKANREVVLTQRRAATHWPSLAHIRRRLKRVAEQVDHYRKKQPAFFGRDIRQITNPRLVGRGHDELAIEHIRRDRQVVPARWWQRGISACREPECRASASAVAPAACQRECPAPAVAARCAAIHTLRDSPHRRR